MSKSKALPKTVAIIGAGPLGRWLALAAARAGFRVLLEDVMPTNLHHAREALRQQIGPEAFHQSAAAVHSVAFVSTIEEAVRDADLAIDCVPDELESKLEIFWLLDRMAPPRTVLATPTTRLSIADLAHCTYRPGQCIAIAVEASELTGNPVLSGQPAAEVAGPAIRLLKTSRTTPETIALVEDFWRQLGFTPAFALDPAEKPAS
ncbi:MAG: 3-hydroxyacyl-CoA dehydrogenase NAD-binding domain-containing protein [Terracidiphilus sp.]|nr:3-hydroxyacyl-CoA dehydrogenase NAD-binding domain-containing protein [Terracidiphilus sp.]